VEGRLALALVALVNEVGIALVTMKRYNMVSEKEGDVERRERERREKTNLNSTSSVGSADRVAVSGSIALFPRGDLAEVPCGERREESESDARKKRERENGTRTT